MPETDQTYAERLSAVLRTKNAGALRTFLAESAENRDPDYVEEIKAIPDEEMEKRMYKMIAARPDLSDMHAEARKWLKDHGIAVSF
jgi:hypothetical protein